MGHCDFACHLSMCCRSDGTMESLVGCGCDEARARWQRQPPGESTATFRGLEDDLCARIVRSNMYRIPLVVPSASQARSVSWVRGQPTSRAPSNSACTLGVASKFDGNRKRRWGAPKKPLTFGSGDVLSCSMCVPHRSGPTSQFVLRRYRLCHLVLRGLGHDDDV
jgi:hypothetical protein